MKWHVQPTIILCPALEIVSGTLSGGNVEMIMLQYNGYTQEMHTESHPLYTTSCTYILTVHCDSVERSPQNGIGTCILFIITFCAMSYSCTCILAVYSAEKVMLWALLGAWDCSSVWIQPLTYNGRKSLVPSRWFPTIICQWLVQQFGSNQPNTTATNTYNTLIP